MLKRIGVACATVVVCLGSATLVGAPVLASVPAGAAPIATLCVAEPHEWLGNVHLNPGQSFSTGVLAAAEPGTQLVLKGYSYSADPTQTSVVSVALGGVVAVEDAVVSGGEIVATNIGPTALTLTTVGVLIDRCHQVAAASGAARATTPDLGGPLPATGSASRPFAGMAALVVLIGGLLVWLSKRGRGQIGVRSAR